MGLRRLVVSHVVPGSLARHSRSSAKEHAGCHPVRALNRSGKVTRMLSDEHCVPIDWTRISTEVALSRRLVRGAAATIKKGELDQLRRGQTWRRPMLDLVSVLHAAHCSPSVSSIH